MPDRAAHLHQAQHNEDLYTHLHAAPQGFADWQITALFYAALHYVEAYLATLNLHSASHFRRDQRASGDALLGPLFQDYRELEERSRDARYNLISIPPLLPQQLRQGEFERIRRPIHGRLGLSP